MFQSFFHLIPDRIPHYGPHFCADCLAELSDASEATRHANMHVAMALGDTLLEMTRTYAAQHPELTPRHIVEALAYLHWKLRRRSAGP